MLKSVTNMFLFLPYFVSGKAGIDSPIFLAQKVHYIRFSYIVTIQVVKVIRFLKILKKK